MKSPSEEDFRAHALVLVAKYRGTTNLEFAAACLKFGYGLAIHHTCNEVAKATEELRNFRESNNQPK